MLEGFNEDAREVLDSAQREATALKHHWIGTEHLLLGLLRDREIARVLSEHALDFERVRDRIVEISRGHEQVEDGEALATLGIDLDQVKARAEASFGPGSLELPQSRPAFTPRVKRVLEDSLRAALEFAQKEITPWHIAFGLLSTAGGVAPEVVQEQATGGVEAVLSGVEARLEELALSDSRPVVDPNDVVTGAAAFSQIFVPAQLARPEFVGELRERVADGAPVLIDAREGGDMLTRYVDAARGFAAALDLAMWPLGRGVYLLHDRGKRVSRASRRAILEQLSTPLS